jgi:hypothetical protein
MAVPVMATRLGPSFPASYLRGFLYPIVQTVVVQHNIGGISCNYDYCQCWHGGTIENSLMLCIIPPLLMLNRLEHQKYQDLLVRETSGMISGTQISEKL